MTNDQAAGFPDLCHCKRTSHSQLRHESQESLFCDSVLFWFDAQQQIGLRFQMLCSDFERFLLAMTHFLHQVRKRKDPLEEYLGEVLDFVYRKAGVLQEAGHGREDDGGPA